jgi:hypothetical protein
MEIYENYINRFVPNLKSDREQMNEKEFEYMIENGNMLKYVYVIMNKDTNLFKIGKADCHKRRLQQLRNQSGANLHLLITLGCERGYDEDNGILEYWLHEQFKSKRKVGEWFALNSRDLVQIRLIGSYIAEVEYNPINIR